MSDLDLHNNEKSKTSTQDVIDRNSKERKLTDQNNDPNRYSTNYVVRYKDIPLTISNINKMSMDEREEVAKYLFDYFRSNGFPFPKYTNQELQEDWNILKELDIYGENVIKNNLLTTNNQAGIDLFKHFSGSCFYNTKEDGKNSKSIVQVFNDDELLKKVIRNRLGITFFYRGVSFPFLITAKMIIQGIRSMRLAPQTSTFRPAVAKFIYEKYTPENGIVYDYSMGFGQRLLGALSSKKQLKYICCDPWVDVNNCVKEMAQYLEGIDESVKNRYTLNNIGSEDFCPDELCGKIDTIFSSPPYYSAEVYDSNNQTQAYSGKNYDQFINIWWSKVANNISKLLKPEGYFAINMVEKVGKNNILNDMLNKMKENGFVEVDRYYLLLSKSHLSGKVGTNNLKKQEPVVIMKKC